MLQEAVFLDQPTARYVLQKSSHNIVAKLESHQTRPVPISTYDLDTGDTLHLICFTSQAQHESG